MIGQRTLADRLAAVRVAQNARQPPPPHAADDRLASPRPLVRGPDRGPAGRHGAGRRAQHHPAAEAARPLAAYAPAAYFDTETTGLSTGAGTVIFLAGVARVDGQRVTVRQFLLPDYPHEAALLRALVADLARGATGDLQRPRASTCRCWPRGSPSTGSFASSRAVPSLHDDLLPDARRLFRRPLGGARLADVESGVLGVRRASDCPGSEVPARYFGYLRGGSPDILAEVLDHNFQDVVSLALLEAEIGRLRAGGWRTRRCSIRAAWRSTCCGVVRWRRRSSWRRRHSTVAGDPAEAHALRLVASRLLIATGRVERAEELWARRHAPRITGRGIGMDRGGADP